MKRASVYGGELDLVLPDHIADWDVLSYWERPRYRSMQARLGAEDRLWLIGAEHGFVAATYAAGIVDPARMVLVEPSPEFWPNIRLTWEANGFASPAGAVQAFASDAGQAVPTAPWPAASDGPECGAQAYRYLHEPNHASAIPATTIDLLADVLEAPTAIAMDIEGAEVLALRGAEAVLVEHRPLLWVSIHPDLIERDYAAHPLAGLYAFMGDLDYHRDLISVDHEHHTLFVPKERFK